VRCGARNPELRGGGTGGGAPSPAAAETGRTGHGGEQEAMTEARRVECHAAPDPESCWPDYC
jgi:hypothetical protein